MKQQTKKKATKREKKAAQAKPKAKTKTKTKAKTKTKTKIRTKTKAIAAPDARRALPHHEALEAMLEAGPDDATWAVYTDFLLAAGVELGPALCDERLRAAFEYARTSPEVNYDNHGDYVFNPADCFQLTWDHGFLEHVRLEDYENRSESATAYATMDDALAAVLASPASRFLRTLTLGDWAIAPAKFSYERAVEMVLRAPGRGSLRDLTLGDSYFGQDNAMLGEPLETDPKRWGYPRIGMSLAPVWTELPNLVVLSVRGSGIELGDVAHKHLIKLALDAPDLDRRASLANARLPALRKLRVTTGWLDELARIDDIMQLVAKTPRLQELTLGHCRVGNAIIAALRDGPTFAELSTLCLRYCALDTTHIPALVALRAKLPALRVLDLSENAQLWSEDDGDEARAALEPLFDRVILD